MQKLRTLCHTVLPRNNLPPRLPASCVHTARILPPRCPQRVTASTWTQSSEHNRKNEQHICILVIILFCARSLSREHSSAFSYRIGKEKMFNPKMSFIELRPGSNVAFCMCRMQLLELCACKIRGLKQLNSTFLITVDRNFKFDRWCWIMRAKCDVVSDVVFCMC